MTDYFALLDLPRRPWIEDEKLKTRYHAKTLQFHPDTSTENRTGEPFAEINEAYQTLRDPRRRLQHLLALENSGIDREAATIPSKIQKLFPCVSEATQRAEAATAKARATSNALSRGLLQAEILRAQVEVEQLLNALGEIEGSALNELRLLDEQWAVPSAGSLGAARRLQLTFTYLSRWTAQLQEKQFQLTIG